MKNLTELFKDKAPDGKKFTDMHKVVTQADLSPATSDKAWSGKPSTTPHDRTKTKQGYMPGEDEKAYDGGDAAGVNDQKTGLTGTALPVVMISRQPGTLTKEEVEVIENEILEIESQIFSDIAEALELDEPALDELITAYTDRKRARLGEG